MENIRNFCIIAHIDHGKSTLADRFLEFTHTVEVRKMKAQYLDQLELERERGITIKMAPVRMSYSADGKNYILNLIDTPGHSDFSYEVSRALEAVEGAVLLVDATQGIQAQTLANFRSAKAAGLKIVGAVNKIDLFKNEEEVLRKIAKELADLIGSNESDIFFVSGKTGIGVKELLDGIISHVPHPKEKYASPAAGKISRALIFDSFYDNHKGVVASVRVVNGTITTLKDINLIATETRSKIKELGFFMPDLRESEELSEGEIGYIATGVKDPEKIKIGDTLLQLKIENSKYNVKELALPGYNEPHAVAFVSFYPEDSNEYELLEAGLQKLKLNDSALTILPDQNEVLGRGFKVGFLGRLHFEITSERLKREFNLSTLNTFPSVIYKIKTKKGWIEIIKPEDLPAEYEEIWEPTVKAEIIVPAEQLKNVIPLQTIFRMSDIKTSTFQERIKVETNMPLSELISDFDDKLKSVSGGYASFSYELGEYVKADIVRVDVLVAGKPLPGLSRFLPRATHERESRKMIERLKELLPRQQFAQSLQASVGTKVIAREDIAAMKKDVTGYLYGGDRTRKMKLWKKQKRGKKRLKERAESTIPPSVFKELLKK